MSTTKVKVKKKVRKNIQTGVAHISATFNNTIVSITDVSGNVVAWSSAGTCGFKGSRKSTPFAAQLAAEDAAKKAMEHGVRNVTVYVDGLAASAASFIMLAGDRIVSARNAFIMIHDAMTGTYGNSGTHREAADLLDKVSANIADMYAERAGEDTEYWRNLMTEKGEDGTWYTGQEALAAGLVDELTQVADDEDVADKLSGWSAMLPPQAREFISDHPAEDDDEDEDDETPEDEQSEEITTEDTAEADAMAWLAVLIR